jgi:Acyl-coenzyme A:6-aminopenicillanic acid acyl-transferase
VLWLACILTIVLLGILIFILKVIVKKVCKKKDKWFCRENKFSGKHGRLKKFGASLLIFGFLILIFNTATRIAYIKTDSDIHGNAEWKISNTQKYLYVEADDRYSLGYLEGKYLATEIVNFRTALMGIGIYMGKTYFNMIDQAQNYLEYIPEAYLEEMQGMADGASQGSGWSFTIDDILLQNTFLDLAYGHWYPEDYLEDNVMGCTAIGAKNEDGTIMIGQNFDFPRVLSHDNFLPSIAFVHTKLKNNPEIFGMRLGAILSLPIAKTTNNITMIVTVIESNIRSNYSLPAVILARMGLETQSTVDGFIDLVFNQHQITCSFTTIGTNGTIMGGVQVHPLDYRINYNKTIVHTNRYLYSDWNEKYFADGDFSLTRQMYVERLVKEKYSTNNTLTYEELIEILGTTVDGVEGPYSAPCYDDSQYHDATLAVFTSRSFGVGNVYQGLGDLPF